MAMGVMNVSTYGFTMIAARILGPRDYGALAGLMATLLVIGVLQLGLQATAARRISADPGHVGQIERSIMFLTYRAALGLGAVLLLLAPLLNLVLRLDSLPTAALVAVTAVPWTVMGGQAGILQGERRWLALSAVYLAVGVPRVVLGTVMMLWRSSEWSAMLAVTLAAFAPALVGWWALRQEREPGLVSDTHEVRGMVREAIHNSQALFAFFALSNADIVLARNVLDEHAAGLYAAGLILAKAVLFLPQFVVVVAFPSMSTVGQRRQALTRSLGLVLVMGVAATVGAAVLSAIALTIVGGPEYADVQTRLWVFAVLGTVLSMLQLLIYSVLARQGQKSTYLVWAAFAALVALALMVHTIDHLVGLVVAIDLGLLVVLTGLSYFRLSAVEPTETAGHTSGP
ncbi:MAG: polysaccharide biosynthesis protein [Nocardioides sp.]